MTNHDKELRKKLDKYTRTVAVTGMKNSGYSVTAQNITAGALIRRPIRRYLMQQGIQFREDKGLLDSVFYLDCTTEQYARVYSILRKAFYD